MAHHTLFDELMYTIGPRPSDPISKGKKMKKVQNLDCFGRKKKKKMEESKMAATSGGLNLGTFL